MTLHILWKAVSSHLFLWPTGSEWHCIFCERQFHHIFSYDQQDVSDIVQLVEGSFIITSFPMTNSKWVTLHILWKAAFSYDQQTVSDIAHLVKGSLITPFPISNSLRVTLHIVWKAVSSHLFIWPTGSEWDCTFCERQGLITPFPITNSLWVRLHILRKPVSSHLFLWPTVCEWYCAFCEMQSHHIFPMTNSLWVILQTLWKASIWCCFLWPIASEWHCKCCERQSHHIFPYDQQHVSDIAQSLITHFPMTNSEWVTLHILWNAISWHLCLWPIASELHCTFCEGQSHHILSYDHQVVSDIAHFVKSSLITSFPMTNRQWVTLHILWKAVSSYLSHHQQLVSDIAHFVKDSLITAFPMANSWGVTLHIFWKAVSSHLLLWPTGCEWHCTCCKRQSHHTLSYGQQQVRHCTCSNESSLITSSISYEQQNVCDIAHFVKGNLITSFPMTNSLWVRLHILMKGSLVTLFPMTNSKWVRLHILWKAVSSCLFMWPTECLWHCTFCEGQSHDILSYYQQNVSIGHFVQVSLITSFPMTNSLWVRLYILWNAISSHPILWPTECEWHCMLLWRTVSSHPFLWLPGCEWHCTFCEKQSHHIFPTESEWLAHFVNGSLITSFPIPTACKWHCTFWKDSVIISFTMTNSKWVGLHILWKAASSHLFLWPTESEWDCTFCERQSHHTFSHDQQEVSEIAHFVNGSLITSFSMTKRMWVRLHMLWKAVLWHLFLWPTECEWDCTCCEKQFHHIFSYDQQFVSEIAHFVKGSLVTSFPMMHRMWVRYHILWKAALCLWPTESERHCTFCERQSHDIFSYDQQAVSDIAHFVNGSLTTCYPMTNRMWVTLHISEREYHHIFSYDQQYVSDIAHVKGSLITFFPITNSLWVPWHMLWKAVSSQHFLWPTACEWDCTFCEGHSCTLFLMTNRMWVTWHILWKTISSHHFLLPTACEWDGTFCERQSHHIISYDQQEVSEIAHFVKGSLITPINSLWVRLHILLKTILSHLFLWPTVCEWDCTCCEDSLITSFPMTNRKLVKLHILWMASSSHLFLWPTACEWDCTFVKGSLITAVPMTNFSLWVRWLVKGSLITSFPMTNSEWVTLHMLGKPILFLWPTGSEWDGTFCERLSSHLFLWPIGSEWHGTFCEMQSHDIFSYN